MINSNKQKFIHLNRRQFAAGLGLGCVGFASSAMAQGANWRAHEGTELRLLMVNHWWTSALEPLVPQFEELTGMKVTFDVFTEDNYFQKAAVELSAGTRNYDGLMVGNLQAGQYMAADWLAPMGEYLADANIVDPNWYQIDDIFASGRGSGSLNGSLYALPVSTECEIVMYRKDVFDAAGIGSMDSLDQMIDAAAALNNGEMAGMVGRGRRGLDIIWVWTGFLLSNGGDFFKDGKAVLNSDAAKGAADIYINKLLRNSGPQGTANMSWLEASTLFKEGNAAMYTDASGLLGVALDKEKSVITDKVDVFAWPGQGANAPGPNYWFWLYGIPKNASNPEAAAMFTAWATSQDVSRTVGVSTGSPVARASVWADEEFVGFYPGNSSAEISKSLASVQAERVPFGEPKFPQVVDAIAVELVNALTSSGDVDVALENANAEVTKIMNG